MKRTATLLLLALCCAPALGAEAGFDAKYATARENLASETGAAYDRQLGLALAALPAIKSAMDACLAPSSGPQDIHGYLEFTAADQYRVVLQPASEFSSCVSVALSGHAVPAPPKLPWYNHFIFTSEEG